MVIVYITSEANLNEVVNIHMVSWSYWMEMAEEVLDKQVVQTTVQKAH